MMKEVKKGDGYKALAKFFSFFDKAEAMRRFDEIMRKYGEKTGSGYCLDAKKLIEICDKLEKKGEGK